MHQAVAQLDYVTIEYAGSDINGANIEVANGRLIVHHSIIRNSLTDGVRFDSNWGGSILESQIVSNTLYGVRNLTPTRAVLATNNWWGDAERAAIGCGRLQHRSWRQSNGGCAFLARAHQYQHEPCHSR